MSDIQIASLFYLAAILLVHLARHERHRAVHRRAVLGEAVGVTEPDGTISLEAHGHVRRRKLVNRLMEALAAIAALGAVAILAIVVFNVLQRGLPAINLDLFTKVQAPFGETGGGIGHAIVGTMILVGLATLMALPFGVLVAIYVSEFARDERRACRSVCRSTS